MEIVSRSPCSLTTSTLRVSGARASVSTGRRVMRQGYRKCKGQPGGWPSGAGGDAYFFADAAGGAAPVLPDVMVPDSARTLGGLLAVAAGEWAPEVSSGFCSGGA